MRTNDRTILITGGAGGIGMAMAARFLAAGNRVLICGRSEDRLRLAKETLPTLDVWRCDLTDPSDVDDLAAHVEQELPQLDMLINNAALNRQLDIHDVDAATKICDEVQANIVGTVNATWRLLPVLERQPDACLAIVTSGIAYAPAPDVPGYSLTKAALHSLARSLRYKLRDTRVRVVEIIPPAVDTDMIRDLRCRKMSPNAVADKVMRGLAKDKREIRMGQTHLTHVLSRISPTAAEMVIRGSF